MSKNVLDRDLCKTFISIFFSWLSNTVLLDSMILSVSQLQTQQVMMSQACYILAQIFRRNLWKI